jgi:feruloyl-CoA synthase
MPATLEGGDDMAQVMGPTPVVRRTRGFAPQQIEVERRADGAILLRSPEALAAGARTTGDWLHRWAHETPERVFIAERSGEGWRTHTYADILQRVRTLAAALLARRLGPERPVLMLSGNGVDHALLMLAAQYVGIPTVPVAEQYSLIPEARGRLRHILAATRPGLVFTVDAGRYADALALDELAGVEVVAARADGARRPVTPLRALESASADAAVDAAHADVGPDTLAKILFTSGSTSMPKGVLTTQRMMCVNQAQIRQVWPFLGERPPRIVDWLPWNHVFGGTHNFNMMLANGGSLYIDEGKPTGKAFATSIRNIRDIGQTISFNVPTAYAMLVAAMREDAALRRAFFGELDLIFYAGASLPQDVWEALEQLAMRERGEVPLMATGWGATETAPSSLMVHAPITRAGLLGAPLPGVTVKLIPDATMRCELRVNGPNVMPGYHRDPERTAAAFDPEAYLVTGDAVRLVDADDPAKGLLFDGRISEDFKLLTGTWVHVSKLRVSALPDLAPLAQDLVITGHDRAEVGALVFPDPAGLAALGVVAGEDRGALVGPALAAALRARLARLAAMATGSSTRIARALVLAEPPSIEAHEITDKGSINQRNVLTRRAPLVSRLYDDADPAVIRV